MTKYRIRLAALLRRTADRLAPQPTWSYHTAASTPTPGPWSWPNRTGVGA